MKGHSVLWSLGAFSPLRRILEIIKHRASKKERAACSRRTTSIDYLVKLLRDRNYLLCFG